MAATCGVLGVLEAFVVGTLELSARMLCILVAINLELFADNCELFVINCELFETNYEVFLIN